MHTRANLPHLTGMRAVAALLVLLGHTVDTVFTFGGTSFYHQYVASFAYLGMTVFFTLSGFVITYGYYHTFAQEPWRKTMRNFIAARFARLYPLYIVVLVLGLHMALLFMHGSWREFLTYFTLTQSWFNTQLYIMPPTWSISTEWFFYIAFALFMLKRPRETNFRRVQISMLVFLMLFPSLLALMYAFKTQVVAMLEPISHPANRDLWEWVMHYSPFVRIGEFIMGAYAARLFMLRDEKKPASDVLLAASFASILFWFYYHISHFNHDHFGFYITINFACAPAIAYILYHASSRASGVSRGLSSRIMVNLGEISYSIYLLQFIIYQFLYYVPPKPSWWNPEWHEFPLLFLKVILFMLATIVAAKLSYRFIEVPSRRWLRKRLMA